MVLQQKTVCMGVVPMENFAGEYFSHLNAAVLW